MKRIGVLMAASLLFLLLCSSGYAATNRSAVQGRAHTAAVSFRLQVSGQDPSLTYWVAYGPLNNHFGLVQLHSIGGNRYAASQQVPSQGRTIFAYLVGHGVIHARFGQAPGDPVMTIKRFGPVELSHIRMSLVRWRVQQPVG